MREQTAADKKRKDLAQAANMITLLQEERPGDIDLAREDLERRGASWTKKLEKGCQEAGIDL